MRSFAALARRNPYVVIGAAALVGWALGSGLVPITIPKFSVPPSPATPATAGAPPSGAAVVATSSASMPPAPSTSDPLGGWNI